MYAATKTCKIAMQTCFVTFDQPLYHKAVKMVSSGTADGDLSSIVVRLGGFHLLMSFMGAVGTIMTGSGLKGVWSTVYAKESTTKMLSGHQYARALRARFLALQKGLLDNI